MGGPILWPAVRLDLDNPADAIRDARHSTDQQSPEQGFGGGQRSGSKSVPREFRRACRPSGPVGQEEKTEVTSEGMIPPKNMSTNGTMLCRAMSAVTDPWNPSKI